MKLIIRADANAGIGTGHLMRCLALAQGWQTAGGAEVTFVTNCESAKLRERIAHAGGEIVEIENSYPHPADLQVTQEVLKKHPQAWCAVDGYHFDAGFHRAVRENGNRVLVIDDTAHLPFYEADAILNQNINAAQLQYDCPKDTILLLGTRYALLRNEFLEWNEWQRRIPEKARKILITLGGSDFHNQTLKAIRAVERLKIENLEIKAVIGASNPHFNELKLYVENNRTPVELIKNTDNMPSLMAWADAAISAAGSTSWEMAFMRLPCLLLILADNQFGIATGLDRYGFAVNLGWLDDVTEDTLSAHLNDLLAAQKQRTKMSELGRKIVDNHGAARVVRKLRDITTEN